MNVRKRYYGAGLVVLLLALGGCASLQRPVGPGNEAAWRERFAALSPLDNWRLTGRAAIAVADDGWSGSLHWVQRGDYVDFRFNGPFGVGGVRIQGNRHALHVKSSNGEDFVTTDPEYDFQQLLGWHIPIHSMRYWVLGLPEPGAPYEKLIDSAGRLYELQQHGWRVTYRAYARAGGPELPARLIIEGPGVRLKMSVDGWEFPEPGTYIAAGSGLQSGP